MALVERQITKSSLPAIYRPAVVRAVLLLFLLSFLPTPWLAPVMPRTSTVQLARSLTEFVIGIPLGLLALSLAWRTFLRALPDALAARGGGAMLHLAFLAVALPFLALGVLWLPAIYWSLLGGYLLGAGGGFFVLLLMWVRRLPDLNDG